MIEYLSTWKTKMLNICLIFVSFLTMKPQGQFPNFSNMYYFHVLIEVELCCITVPKEKCIYFSSKIEEINVIF